MIVVVEMVTTKNMWFLKVFNRISGMTKARKEGTSGAREAPHEESKETESGANANDAHEDGKSSSRAKELRGRGRRDGWTESEEDVV